MSIKKLVNDNGVTIDFDGDSELICKLDDLPQSMIHRLAIHGLSQKVGDAYSGHNGMQDAYQKACEVYGSLKADQWNTGKSGGGGDLIEALVQETKKDREEVAARIGAMSKEERTALRKNAKVKARLDGIKAQRAAERAAAYEGISVEELLA